LLFDVRGNQCRPTLIKSELCQNLIANHKTPKDTRYRPGELRLDGGRRIVCGGLLVKGA
jgi:hypothetical protein